MIMLGAAVEVFADPAAVDPGPSTPVVRKSSSRGPRTCRSQPRVWSEPRVVSQLRFHGERIVGTVGRVTRGDRLCVVSETCVTASSHRPAESGDSRRASAAAPGSALAREGEAQPTPRARTDPAHFPAETLALVVTLAIPHASNSGTSRLQLSILGAGSARLAGAVGERP